MEANEAPTNYAFVLKLTDQPGGMEIIGATFAHRGVSVGCTLGNDGAFDPEGRATVIVTFRATPAKKEILRRALGRLSRVRSLVAYPLASPHLRKTAVFRVAGRLTGDPQSSPRLEELARHESADETTYLLVDLPEGVDAFLENVRATGRLRDATTTVVGV